MLTVITGNPGNGKSLYTTVSVEKLRVESGRPVYYHGIPELKYQWLPMPVTTEPVYDKNGREVKQLQAVDWAAMPDGSIVVIDECYSFLPKRPQGAATPAYVDWMARHRHRGFDIFLCTQNAKKQVDTFVLALVGKHIHLDRKFGMSYSMRYEWERLADPGLRSDLAIAQSGRWMFPKEAYGTYKSATEHTHKVKLPWKKIITLAAGLVVVVGAVTFAFHVLSAPKKGATAVDSSGRKNADNKVLASNDYWVKDRRERVAGIPASAPLYDPLQKVKSQPRPLGCMRLDIGAVIRCECTGPNGSLLQISTPQCIDLVKHGWFDETEKYADPKAQNIAQLNAAERGGVATTAAGASKTQDDDAR